MRNTTKPKKKSKGSRPARGEGGPIAVVLLSSLTELGVVKAVARNGKTTELCYYARDFGTVAKAREFIAKGMAPPGYRGHAEVIDGSRPKVTQSDITQATFI